VRLLLIIIEEVINALLNESVVNVVIPLGIGVTTTGVGNLGAPVISKTTTTLGIVMECGKNKRYE
jgi:hypothetical protein